MTMQGSESPPEDFIEELEVASISGGIVAIGTLVYYGVEPIATGGIEAGVFFVLMIALGTFTFSMFNMILDQPKAFTGWVSQISWTKYSMQAGAYVVFAVGVMVLIDRSLFFAATNVLAIAVMYVTMISVGIWLTRESLGTD